MEDGFPRRKGFRGTAENAKTKVCLRCEVATPLCMHVVDWHQVRWRTEGRCHHQVEKRALPVWGPVQLCSRR